MITARSRQNFSAAFLGLLLVLFFSSQFAETLASLPSFSKEEPSLFLPAANCVRVAPCTNALNADIPGPNQLASPARLVAVKIVKQNTFKFLAFARLVDNKSPPQLQVS